MSDGNPQELLSLAKVVQAKVEEACPDMHPLKMRAVALLVGEAFLQSAALDEVNNKVYRRPPTK